MMNHLSDILVKEDDVKDEPVEQNDQEFPTKCENETNEAPIEYTIHQGNYFTKKLVAQTGSDIIYSKYNFTLRNDTPNTHLEIHNGERPYQCSQCEKSFPSTNYLRRHMKRHTKKKLHKCRHCNKKFLDKCNLKIHVRTHTGEKSYPCNYCDKAFSRKGQIDIHLRSHTGEKPYKCGNCDKSFSEKRSLHTHLRSHTGEKPYKCGNCDKSFSEKRSLQYHLENTVCNNEDAFHMIGRECKKKSYPCNCCDKVFSRKGQHEIHFKSHTGEKPYQCGNCNYEDAFHMIGRDCKEKNSDCHCSNMIRKLSEKCSANDIVILDNKQDDTFVIRIGEDGDLFYICNLCRRYASQSRSTADGENWSGNGISFKNKPGRQNQYFDAHKNSLAHKASIERMKTEERKKQLKGSPTIEQTQASTKNVCTTVQFMVDQGLISHDLPFLATWLNNIIPDDQPNPLGNFHCAKSFTNVLTANFSVTKKDLATDLKKINPVTKQVPKHTLVIGKGLTIQEATRQVCMTTYLDYNNKKIHEKLLVSEQIYENGSAGSQENVNKVIKEILNPNDIFGTCTGDRYCFSGASNDKYNNKVLRIPNVCQKIELLHQKDTPDWVKNTLRFSQEISNILHSKSQLSKLLFHLSIEEKKVYLFFKPVFGISETKYTEHLCHHIESIFRNVNVFMKYLPLIIDSPDLSEHHEKANTIYESIKDPNFMVKLLVINLVCLNAALAEKDAKKTEFNAFGFYEVIVKLKQELCKLKYGNLKRILINHLQKGYFNYSSNYKQKDYVDATKLISYVINMKEEIIKDFDKWVSNILDNFIKYCDVPSYCNKIVEFFDKNTDHVKRHQIIKWCFRYINLDFVPCGDSCEGSQSCVCLYKEIERFQDHYSKILESEIEKTADKVKAYTDAVVNTFFHSDTPELNITNICRLIELSLIMKANQSSTERDNSLIENFKDRFEEQNASSKISDDKDMIDVLTFCKINTNHAKLNSKGASTYFVKKLKKEEKFLKTKLINTMSRIVIRTRKVLLTDNRNKNQNSLNIVSLKDKIELSKEKAL